MSVVTTPEQHACEADGCAAIYTEPEAVHGSFCSEACYYRDRGAGALEQLADDPTLCANCFRALVHPGLPEDGGVFYHPPSGVDVVDETDEPFPPRTHRPRLGCRCGAVDTAEPDDILRAVQPERELANEFWRALNRLAAKGAIPDAPDRDAFREAFEGGVRDWAELAGRSVYADE